MAKKTETEMFADIVEVKPSQTVTTEKSESDILLEQLKTGLIKLGLKGIEDLNNKRVQNPAPFYDSLTALYNAVKK